MKQKALNNIIKKYEKFTMFLKIKILIFLFIFSCTKNQHIKDVNSFPQNHKKYFNNIKYQITKAKLLKIEHLFFKKILLPWKNKNLYHNKSDFFWAYKHFKKNLGYGENKRKHKKEWYLKILKNSNLKNFPNRIEYGIAIRNSSFRAFPTKKPHFSDLKKPGFGYPFDNLQISTLLANTPVKILHESKLKNWYVVETYYAIGWVYVDDIAFVDKGFIESWKSKEYVVAVRDGEPVYLNNIFRFKAKIGSLYPLVKEEEGKKVIKIALSGVNKKGLIKKTRVKDSCFKKAPLKIRQENLITIANELTGRAYGWGGLYGNRDCSTMLRNLFFQFYLALPRNSFLQSKSGFYYSLKGLTGRQKKETIKRIGIPYVTLLFMKGHVMLYIGMFKNKIAIFHSFWGVRTAHFFKKDKGRRVVGRAVVTSLEPGKELDDYDFCYSLINKIEGMTFVLK